MLRSGVIDSLLDTLQVGVAYFYFHYNDKRQTAEYVITSLLKQLVRQFMTIPSSLESAYDMSERSLKRPSENDFTKLLTECAKEFFKTYRSPVFVLVDAFDECQEAEREKLVAHLQEFYISEVRLYITTRNQFGTELQEAFDGAKSLEIKATLADVESYLRKRLSTKDFGSKLTDNIVTTIKDLCKGWYCPHFTVLTSAGFCWWPYNWRTFSQKAIL
jgi:hypothetical protein